MGSTCRKRRAWAYPSGRKIEDCFGIWWCNFFRAFKKTIGTFCADKFRSAPAWIYFKAFNTYLMLLWGLKTQKFKKYRNQKKLWLQKNFERIRLFLFNEKFTHSCFLNRFLMPGSQVLFKKNGQANSFPKKREAFPLSVFSDAFANGLGRRKWILVQHCGMAYSDQFKLCCHFCCMSFALLLFTTYKCRFRML